MAENRKLEVESWKKKNKEQRKVYRDNIKEYKRLYESNSSLQKVKKIDRESKSFKQISNGVDITRDMKNKEIVRYNASKV